MVATLPRNTPTELAALALAGDDRLPSLSSVIYPDIEIHSTDPEAPAAEQFVVDDFSKANWCASRIVDAQARIDQRSELARSYIERIRTWLEAANASDQETVSYLSTLLRPFVESAVAQQHRSRSLILVSAVASLRKLPDHLEITDAAAALAYCKTHHPEAVVVREDLSKTELKKLALDGTAIPGVAMELGADQLYVKSSIERSLQCAS